MIPEALKRTNTEELSTVAQEQPPSGTPPPAQSVPPTFMSEVRREAPPPAAPPEPPRDRIAASIHRMPRGWRWTLGLGLAFLGGVSAALVAAILLPQVISVPLVIVAGVLAFAAGFVLSTWWATLLQEVAVCIGALVTIWLVVMMSPADSIVGWGSTVMGAVSNVFGWFAVLGLLPFFVFLLVGVGVGRWRRVGAV